MEQQQQELEVQKARATLKKWQDLHESPGWALLREILQGQIQLRQGQVMTPTAAMGKELGIDAQLCALHKEFTLGELGMAALIVRLPETQIEVLTNELKGAINES